MDYPKALMVTIGYHLVQLVVDSMVANKWAMRVAGKVKVKEEAHWEEESGV